MRDNLPGFKAGGRRQEAEGGKSKKFVLPSGSDVSLGLTFSRSSPLLRTFCPLPSASCLFDRVYLTQLRTAISKFDYSYVLRCALWQSLDRKDIAANFNIVRHRLAVSVVGEAALTQERKLFHVNFS